MGAASWLILKRRLRLRRITLNPLQLQRESCEALSPSNHLGLNFSGRTAKFMILVGPYCFSDQFPRTASAASICSSAILILEKVRRNQPIAKIIVHPRNQGTQAVGAVDHEIITARVP